jgi:hypothetical protein
MTEDLVKRLRDMCGRDGILAIRDIYDHDVAEAADRIEKLEAALRSIAANACCDSCREAALVARKALEGKDG